MTSEKAIVEDLLAEISKGVKVTIVSGHWERKGKQTSPFSTRHVFAAGEFLAHESELSFDVIAHEYGHFVAWMLAGCPNEDDFGCAGVVGRSPGVSDALERDACCIEMVLRRDRMGQTFQEVSERMLQGYDYQLDLDFVDGVGYVGGEEYMHKVFARGEEILARQAEEVQP